MRGSGAVLSIEDDRGTARVSVTHLTDGREHVDEEIAPRVDPALHLGRIARSPHRRRDAARPRHCGRRMSNRLLVSMPK